MKDARWSRMVRTACPTSHRGLFGRRQALTVGPAPRPVPLPSRRRPNRPHAVRLGHERPLVDHVRPVRPRRRHPVPARRHRARPVCPGRPPRRRDRRCARRDSASSSSSSSSAGAAASNRIPGRRTLSRDALTAPPGTEQDVEQAKAERQKALRFAKESEKAAAGEVDADDDDGESPEGHDAEEDKIVSIDLDVRFKDLKASVPVRTPPPLSRVPPPPGS